MAGWRDHGSKPGSGGVASHTQDNVDRRERLRQLALETIDLAKDPYFMRNHLGSYECKLCLTLHNNEGNYLAHTQGKRHQQNLARRAAREAKENPNPQPIQPVKKKPIPRKTVKIGRPGYKVTKQKDPETGQFSLLFEVEYPEIEEGLQPRHRFMSAFEQRIEPVDKNFQYLLIAAEPYETIAFKIPNWEIERSVDPDKTRSKFWTEWNKDKKTFRLQLHFKKKEEPQEAAASSNPLPPSSNPLPPQPYSNPLNPNFR
eukprot:TRINITY_DN14946_c0_g1_i1.p1 TRINITY_DN14946_c0_g1~~TRINITY_DN14946_c0_g1_i1.p1  ORF type:complete len:258 (-),score=62.09 TRINITY_DN14946_c0_g1_i1:40-813(-)